MEGRKNTWQTNKCHASIRENVVRGGPFAPTHSSFPYACARASATCFASLFCLACVRRTRLWHSQFALYVCGCVLLLFREFTPLPSVRRQPFHSSKSEERRKRRRCELELRKPPKWKSGGGGRRRLWIPKYVVAESYVVAAGFRDFCVIPISAKGGKSAAGDTPGNTDCRQNREEERGPRRQFSSFHFLTCLTNISLSPSFPFKGTRGGAISSFSKKPASARQCCSMKEERMEITIWESRLLFPPPPLAAPPPPAQSPEDLK